MYQNAFTEGVRPGGLTTAGETRILLCYLLSQSKLPLARENLEYILLNEELANYFVLAEALDILENGELVTKENDTYTLTPRGLDISRQLENDVPRSVKDTALRAVIRQQSLATKEKEHRATISESNGEYLISCAIGEEDEKLFSMQLHMPDALSAEAARKLFVQNGDEIYKLVLEALTSTVE